MSRSISDELWAWEGVQLDSSLIKLIPLTIFWVIWKERNSITFEGKETDLYRLRDRLMHYFGFILLEYDIISDVNFGNVIDSLIIM